MGVEVPAELTALAAAGGLVLVMRWVFRTPRSRSGTLVDAADSAELGLLTVVATGLARTRAKELRERLDSAGIRASTSRRHDGTADLLVFRDDLDRARAVLDS